MKARKIFSGLSALAMMAFAVGCSDDLHPEENPEENGGAVTRYMSVNLVSSDDAGTRAAAGYEDGSLKENKVENVRFYFFTENGQPANVKLLGSQYVNYFDWSPADGDQAAGTIDSDDIESNLKATIVINTQSGDKLPQRIVAVINPAKDPAGNYELGIVSMSLGELEKIVKDYATADFTKQGKFVMFNSVYKDEDNKTVLCAERITSDHLQKTEALAEANPVDIYVERCVAKVRVKIAESVGFTEGGLLALKDKEGVNLTVQGKQVYLKLSDWSLTAETDKSRLVKKVDFDWDASNNGTHRSFWAMNAESAKNRYYDYPSIDTKFGEDKSKYTNENAADFRIGATSTNLNRTKVILKGTLCDENGTALTLVRHLGAHFIDTYSENRASNMPALKANILSQLAANGHNYYYETTVDGKTARKQIETNDLQIVPAAQQPAEGSKNNCYVYAQLTDDVTINADTKKTWYDSLDPSAQPINFSVINNALKNKEVVDWPLVWKDGMTYYFYEIIHSGTGENATKGVVRNHIYDTTITKIAGFGTPVYDPTLTIYPEKPDPNDHYVAARIKILSWRVVSNNYALEW